LKARDREKRRVLDGDFNSKKTAATAEINRGEWARSLHYPLRGLI
jgi:hypothetical protein